jgi:hypothetical protein
MKKIDRKILKLFLFGLPFVIGMALLASTISLKDANNGSVLDYYNSFSGLVFGIWMFFSLYLSVRLLFSGNFRADILPCLTFFRERDERELLITARATRNSFLTTLALLILLLFLSVFQVAIFRVPQEQAENGKTGTITLGVNMSLTNDSPGTSSSILDYFRYSGLPLSNSAVILFLILWQLSSFNYFLRKIEKEPLNISGLGR